VGGVSPPQVAGEKRLELGGDEAHLRRELAELLAGVEEMLREPCAQEDDGLSDFEAFIPKPDEDKA
jgi:hypothetical protein